MSSSSSSYRKSMSTFLLSLSFVVFLAAPEMLMIVDEQSAKKLDHTCRPMWRSSGHYIWNCCGKGEHQLWCVIGWRCSVAISRMNEHAATWLVGIFTCYDWLALVTCYRSHEHERRAVSTSGMTFEGDKLSGIRSLRDEVTPRIAG